MDDFRVKTSWRTSGKRRRLKRLLGAEAVLAIQDLWSYCAQERTDGDLTGLSNEDIADNTDWAGTADDLVAALTACKLLDGEQGKYRIHDWVEHNPYVATHAKRSEAARQAVNVRWERVRAAKQAMDSTLQLPNIRIDTTRIRPVLRSVLRPVSKQGEKQGIEVDKKAKMANRAKTPVIDVEKKSPENEYLVRIDTTRIRPVSIRNTPSPSPIPIPKDDRSNGRSASETPKAKAAKRPPGDPATLASDPALESPLDEPMTVAQVVAFSRVMGWSLPSPDVLFKKVTAVKPTRRQLEDASPIATTRRIKEAADKGHAKPRPVNLSYILTIVVSRREPDQKVTAVKPLGSIKSAATLAKEHESDERRARMERFRAGTFTAADIDAAG